MRSILPTTPDEWTALRVCFEGLGVKARNEARRRSQVLDLFDALVASGSPVCEAQGEAAEHFGVSADSIKRWRRDVAGVDVADRYLVLAPGWKAPEGPRVALHEGAWNYILSEWLVLSRPTLTAVHRRAQREAARRGWGELPSVSTIQRRIKNEVPHTTIVLKRHGEKALEKLYPAMERDYSSLKVHELWVSDARKADLFVRFPDGEIARPMVMAWLEVRSRFNLGWSVGKTENTPLVRASLRNAMQRSKAVPRQFLLDNGRAYASKEITGGQPNRFRFKVNDDDLLGVATLLDIGVTWAIPGHGQSKPIESFWRNMAATDKRAEFAGAYCGNRPDAKPEEFDVTKAVPLQQYLDALAEDFDAYNARPHRGDSMKGESPSQCYTRLMAQTIVRRPTDEQIRLCMMAAENVTLSKTDHSVTILGNRYWTERLSDLTSRGPYTVRYDADDASSPVHVYDGDRFVCSAPLLVKSGFRSQEAAKAHNRARNQWEKARRQQAKAIVAQVRAADWMGPGSPAPAAPQKESLGVAPMVAELVTTKRKAPKFAQPANMPSDAEFAALLNRAITKEQDAALARGDYETMPRAVRAR